MHSGSLHDVLGDNGIAKWFANTVILVGVLLCIFISAAGVYVDSLVLILELLLGIAGFLFIIRWLTGAIWRPAILLLIQIPFQAVIGRIYPSAPNLITWVFIVAFLIQVPREQLVQLFLGSRTQKLCVLFLFSISFSYLYAADNIELIPDFLQKVTLIVIVSILAIAFRQPTFLQNAAIVIVLSVGIIFIVGAIEFVSEHRVLGDLFANTANYRLGVAGMPINRSGFYALLPLTVALGFLIYQRKSRFKWLFILLFPVLALGLTLTGSRGGTLGSIVALFMLWLFSKYKLRFALLLSVSLFVGSYLLTSYGDVSVSQLYTTRWIGRDNGGLLTFADTRLNTWKIGLMEFLSSPLWGIGWGNFNGEWIDSNYGAVVSQETADSAHSSYIELLSETGLLGTIPFVLLIIHVLYVLWRFRQVQEETATTWNKIAFAAFVGMLVACLTSVYSYERYFWIPVSIAAAAEQMAKAQSRFQG